MSSFSLQIRTANRDRKAEIEVEPEVRVQDLLDSAKENWSLSNNYEYILRHERLGKQLQPTDTLASAGVQAGDVLEIQQISDAGCDGAS